MAGPRDQAWLSQVGVRSRAQGLRAGSGPRPVPQQHCGLSRMRPSTERWAVVGPGGEHARRPGSPDIPGVSTASPEPASPLVLDSATTSHLL